VEGDSSRRDRRVCGDARAPQAVRENYSGGPVWPVFFNSESSAQQRRNPKCRQESCVALSTAHALGRLLGQITVVHSAHAGEGRERLLLFAPLNEVRTQQELLVGTGRG